MTGLIDRNKFGSNVDVAGLNILATEVLAASPQTFAIMYMGTGMRMLPLSTKISANLDLALRSFPWYASIWRNIAANLFSGGVNDTAVVGAPTFVGVLTAAVAAAVVAEAVVAETVEAEAVVAEAVVTAAVMAEAVVEEYATAGEYTAAGVYTAEEADARPVCPIFVGVLGSKATVVAAVVVAAAVVAAAEVSTEALEAIATDKGTDLVVTAAATMASKVSASKASDVKKSASKISETALEEADAEEALVSTFRAL